MSESYRNTTVNATAASLVGRAQGLGYIPTPNSQMSVPETLRLRRETLAQQLSEIDQAIAALDANPELERVLHLVSKVGLY